MCVEKVSDLIIVRVREIVRQQLTRVKRKRRRNGGGITDDGVGEGSERLETFVVDGGAQVEVEVASVVRVNKQSGSGSEITGPTKLSCVRPGPSINMVPPSVLLILYL